MDKYSRVYGRFYRNSTPIEGTALFTPKQRYDHEFGTTRYIDTLSFTVRDGELVDGEGNPGASIPASFFGLLWEVRVLPLNYSTVLQLFPGDIISIGD